MLAWGAGEVGAAVVVRAFALVMKRAFSIGTGGLRSCPFGLFGLLVTLRMSFNIFGDV